MRPAPATRSFLTLRWLLSAVCVCLAATTPLAGSQRAAGDTSRGTSASATTFGTPERAANALVAAAERFDVGRLIELFGPNGQDIVLSGEYAQDQQRAADFVAKAHEKMIVSLDPNSRSRAYLIVGAEDWPFPVPIVKRRGRWSFDTAAGLQEIRARRIGSNELDAIQIARGYVDAQHEYALKKREGYDVNQYAQRIISTPGKQDGLAWQNPDGTWNGPVGEKVARAIQQGYTSGEPYHGYFFKVLKGQGPAAPLGTMNFVVNGAMIGGFALAAAPAEYGVSGIKTFMVSHDGVVYEKDFGPATLEQFRKMDRFNPDSSWTPVLED